MAFGAVQGLYCRAYNPQGQSEPQYDKATPSPFANDFRRRRALPTPPRRVRRYFGRGSLRSTAAAFVPRSRGSEYRGRGGDLRRGQLCLLSTSERANAAELVAGRDRYRAVYSAPPQPTSPPTLARCGLGRASRDCDRGNQPEISTRFLVTPHGVGFSQSPYDSAIGQRFDFSLATLAGSYLSAFAYVARSRGARLAAIFWLAWFAAVSAYRSYALQRDRRDAARGPCESRDYGPALCAEGAASRNRRSFGYLASVRVGGQPL